MNDEERAAGRSPEDVDPDGELEPAEALEDFLETIVEGLGLQVQVEVEEQEGLLSGRVVGEDVGLFIGRHGQTIDAVQHLAQRIVFPDGPSPVRVVIDAGGYRERREEALRAQAATRMTRRTLSSRGADTLSAGFVATMPHLTACANAT